MIRPFLPPAAFLLDLDGVLVQSNEAHVRSYRRALEAHGLVLPSNATKMIEAGVSREVVMVEARVPRALMRAVSEAKEAAFLALVASGDVAVSPGARPFLEALRWARTKVALVSSSATAVPCIRALGVESVFDAVVDGTMVTRPKPAPDSYTLAARLLDVNPSHCVVVEDSPAGAAAARTAGTFVVGVGTLLNHDDVDALYPDLPAIPLEEWLGEPSAPSGPQTQ